jgi:hypothetical protein
VKIPNHVIFDRIGEDAVAINFLTGVYYVVDKNGAEIMNQLQSGLAPAPSRTLHLLILEGLIDGGVVEELERKDNEVLPFKRFTDLELLLTADPVHDVDDYGWPKLN